MMFSISYVVFSLILFKYVFYTVVSFTFWLRYPNNVFVIGYIQTNSKARTVVENLREIVSVNFLKFSVNRGEIQLRTPTEGQVLYTSCQQAVVQMV